MRFHSQTPSDGFGPDPSHRQRPVAPSDLDLARPQTAGEEELQLQLALAMSREEAEKEEEKRRSDEVRLALAISQSQQDSGLVASLSYSLVEWSRFVSIGKTPNRNNRATCWICSTWPSSLRAPPADGWIRGALPLTQRTHRLLPCHQDQK